MYRLVEAVDTIRANIGTEQYAIDEGSNMLSIVKAIGDSKINIGAVDSKETLIEEFRRRFTSEKYDAPSKWYNSATVDNVLNPDKNTSKICIDTFVEYSKALPES